MAFRGRAAGRACALRSRHHVPRGDRIAIAILALISISLYLPFTLSGHPLIPGDDLTQNYPLRVLAGTLLREGHLPLWDPFIWSGTPLLAGWNAGALYPGTLLFAILPGVIAWTVNLVLVSLITSLGVYLLLRLYRCGPLASILAALCFTYTGFMSGQLNHFGLVQGTSYLAWMLIAIELLARAPTVRSAIWPWLLLGASVGLCVLAGEPRAVSSAVIMVILYLVVRAIQLGQRRALPLLIEVITGAALGAGLSAVQWLPGLTFISRSQRTLDAFASFGEGSLTWLTIGHNLLVPFLLGGNGDLGLFSYVGSYNLPEVTIGVGLLPLVAVCAYLPELLRRCQTVAQHLAYRHPLRRGGDNDPGSPAGRALGIWYLTGIVGCILTLGSTTPIGHLLLAIPLYGGERLQNRNAVLFDFALAVLFGFFVDDLIRARAKGTGNRLPALHPLRGTIRRLLGAVPILACLALVVLAFVDPLGLQRRLGVAHPLSGLFTGLSPYLLATVALAVAIGVFLLMVHRLSRRTMVIVVTLLSCADFAVYLVNAPYGSVSSSVLSGPTATSARLAKLTQGGRFAIYNPLVRNAPGTVSLGETDLNVLRGQMSIQGYSSIVGGSYEEVTDTHSYEMLDPALLKDGTADAIDLRVLLTLPTYLDEAIPPHSAIPVAGGPPVTSSGLPGPTTDAPARPPRASGPWTIKPSGEKVWHLPSVSQIIRVTVVVNAKPAAGRTVLGVGVAASGAPSTMRSVRVIHGQAHLVLPAAERGESITVRDRSDRSVTIGAVVAVTHSPDERLLLDGTLQSDLPSPQWSFAGTMGTLSVFVNHDADGVAWLEPRRATSSVGPVHTVTGLSTTVDAATGAEQMRVSLRHPALLVRSVDYQQGWTAQVTPLDGGPSRTARVRQLGLLQAVELPAGDYLVTWRYAPRSILVGGVLTLVSIALFLVLLVLAAFGRRPLWIPVLPAWYRARR